MADISVRTIELHPDEDQDLKERVAKYMEARLTGERGYLGYYDRTAAKMKRRHLQNRAAAAIAAVLIPVVANVPWEPFILGASLEVSRIASSVLGVFVALIIALEGVFHYKDQWQNYRGTEQ